MLRVFPLKPSLPGVVPAGTTPGNDGFSGNTRNTAQWGQQDVHMIPGPGRFIQNNRLFYTSTQPGVPDDNHIYRFWNAQDLPYDSNWSADQFES